LRRKVGYMTQKFRLRGPHALENLRMANIHSLGAAPGTSRIEAVSERYSLGVPSAAPAP
jgi:hypothetical protein